MIKIEKMTLQHYAEIEEVLLDEFDDFWSPSILKSEIENINSKYIVAKDENEILGFAGILITPVDAEITNIVTKKSHRKKGIGKLLLDKLINMAKKQNIDNINLEVNENNEVAIHLYQKSGFEKVGIRKKYYDGVNNAIIMIKKIKN